MLLTLFQIPALLGFVFGLTIWLNFKRFTDDSFYVWWPVVLVCVSGLILFNPFPILYHRSRLWFAYSTVSHSLEKSVTQADIRSGDYASLVSFLSSLETFSWVTCFAHRPTLLV